MPSPSRVSGALVGQYFETVFQIIRDGPRGCLPVTADDLQEKVAGHRDFRLLLLGGDHLQKHRSGDVLISALLADDEVDSANDELADVFQRDIPRVGRVVQPAVGIFRDCPHYTHRDSPSVENELFVRTCCMFVLVVLPVPSGNPLIGPRDDGERDKCFLHLAPAAHAATDRTTRKAGVARYERTLRKKTLGADVAPETGERDFLP